LLNQSWLRRRLPDRTYGAVLKTDLFDEAAGEGVYAPLQARTARFCGIDISASTCRLATARCARLAATVADVRCLPFADESFDLVLSLSTLDHFASASEIERALRCLHRVLRPGGCLLITLDNLSNPLVWIRNFIPWRMLEKTRLVPYPVGVTLRAAGLRKVLEDAGFEVQHLGTLMHVLRVPAVLLGKPLEGAGDSWAGRLFCRVLLWFEFLSRLPTAKWTGNYIAVSCSKQPRP
jgi:ubiquinone/menaquinone biosynthesis C-methylase UbiE